MSKMNALTVALLISGISHLRIAVISHFGTHASLDSCQLKPFANKPWIILNSSNLCS